MRLQSLVLTLRALKKKWSTFFKSNSPILLDMVAKIGVYFVHERVWNHINFGRTTKAPEYEI